MSKVKMPSKNDAKSSIDKFLELVTPYNQLVGMLVAVVAAAYSLVSWANSHFAVEQELYNLECRMMITVAAQARPVQASLLSLYTTEIESRKSQITMLSQRPVLNKNEIEMLRADVLDLQSQRISVDQNIGAVLDTASTKCAIQKS